MSEVVWSVNIMLAILLIGVGVALYYIFMYDTWYPNEQRSEDSSLGSEDGSHDGSYEGTHP